MVLTKLLHVMTLKVIIVGAGIGGICAALALRKAGHDVQVGSARNTQELFSLLVIIESSRPHFRQSTLLFGKERQTLTLSGSLVIRFCAS